MRDVNVSDLKNKLSEYLRLVKQGEVIQVLERSTPIATIRGISPCQGKGDALLNRLVREGVVTPAARGGGKDVVGKSLIPCDGDAVGAVTETRRDR